MTYSSDEIRQITKQNKKELALAINFLNHEIYKLNELKDVLVDIFNKMKD